MKYTATVETHRRDYQGTLANAPTRTFDTLREAQRWANGLILSRSGRFGVIESEDGYYSSTDTDGLFDVEDLNSYTETMRRLRAAADLCRSTFNLPRNWRVEVGTRWLPAYGATITAAIDDTANAAANGDDLYGQCDMKSAAKQEQVQGDGYVAHLYFYSTGDWGELEDVRTVWLGTADTGPSIIH